MKSIFPFFLFLILSFAVQAQVYTSTGSVSDTISPEEDVYEGKMLDKMPSYPGGFGEMIKFIEQKIIYPAEAKKQKLEGTVLLSLVINRNGNVQEIHVVKGIDPSLNEEAIRIVQLMPRWEPAIIRNNAVDTSITVPFRFKLPTR